MEWEEVYDKYKISDEEERRIGEYINQIMLAGKVPSAKPIAIIDIGPTGSGKTALNGYALKQFENNNLVIVNNDELIGFISLFKYDGDEKRDLTPWYATMFVKDKYRKKGYSKILNDAIIKKAKELNYSKVYLKSNLVNYYEKFGAKYIENLNNGEKLYYIDLE